MTVEQKSRADMVAKAVAVEVGRLQAEYLPTTSRTQPTPRAAAAMATLRRAPANRPGDDPVVWAHTLPYVPEELRGWGDDPSRAERAIHAALVLYAVHQQSRGEAMHRKGPSLGAAARALAAARSAGDSPDRASIRRFQTVATATSYGQTLYHLRSFVKLLRAVGVPLDHGRLAADLYRLQFPTAAPGVRLRWGRDLYRRAGADGVTDAPNTQRPPDTGAF